MNSEMKLIHVFVMVVCFSIVKSQTTTMPSMTTFKMCRDTSSSGAPTGILQPLDLTTANSTIVCPFYINLLPAQLIQFSCSVLTFPYENLLKILPLYGWPESNVTKIVKNRVYTSSASGLALLSVPCLPSKGCWFDCKWTMIPAPLPTTTEFKLCRHGYTGNAVGNIQPLDGDVEAPRTCTFSIIAPVDKQVQLTCSVLNFTDTLPQVSFQILTLDNFRQNTEVNRVYTSRTNQMMLYFYRPVNANWFSCNWTMVPNAPSTATDFRLCRHAEARMENGTIQPMDGGITGPSRECGFSIIAPVGQYLRISCSVANFTSTKNFLRLSGIAYTDSFLTGLLCARPELNKVYTSTANQIDLLARIEDSNWFKCNWTTTKIAPTAITSTTVPSGLFKLCRDLNSTASNGTLQQLAGTTASKQCNFTIQVPPDQRVQLSCSVIKSVSLRVDDAVVTLESPTSYVFANLNKVYTSFGNQLRLIFTANPAGWIDCKWATIPAISNNTSKFELCRDSGTVNPNGIVQSPDWEPDTSCSDDVPRNCSFLITAPPDYRVQLSCPMIKNFNNFLGNSGSQTLRLKEVADYFTIADGSALPVFENRIYTSASNRLYLLREGGEPQWISCNWTMKPRTTTTDYKLCSDSGATSTSGTIQPLDKNTGKPRSCPFNIILPPDNFIFLTCPVLNLTSDSSIKISGTAEIINQPVANTIYASAQNQMIISSTIVNSDWFMCSWTSIKINRICQDRNANSTTGIIQPVKGLVNGPRNCLFTISVPVGQRVQISCSDVTLNGMTSSLDFTEEQNSVVAHEPIVDMIYTSKSNRMFVSAVVNATDSFNCKWTAI